MLNGGCCAGYRALSGPFPSPKHGRPVFIALVDTSAGPDFLELVKLAIAATLDVLPANALVGIITVSGAVSALLLACLLACIRFGCKLCSPCNASPSPIAGHARCPDI